MSVALHKGELYEGFVKEKRTFLRSFDQVYNG
jgi:hypothetical protein